MSLRKVDKDMIDDIFIQEINSLSVEVETAITNGLIKQATPPSGVIEGRLWLDTSDNTYQGTHLESLPEEVASNKLEADERLTQITDQLGSKVSTVNGISPNASGDVSVIGDKGEKGDTGSAAVDQNTISGVGNIRIWTGTQSEYDSIVTKDNEIIYFVRGV